MTTRRRRSSSASVIAVHAVAVPSSTTRLQPLVNLSKTRMSAREHGGRSRFLRVAHLPSFLRRVPSAAYGIWRCLTAMTLAWLLGRQRRGCALELAPLDNPLHKEAGLL